MADLIVGRVGTDVTLRVQQIGRQAGPRGELVDIAGVLMGTTVAEATRLRDELAALAAMPHSIIPVTYATDPTLDGYYRLVGADVEAVARDAPLFDGGYLPYSLTVEKVGVEGEVEVEDVLVGTVRTNSHGVDSAEAEPWIGVPSGYYMLATSVTNPTLLSRTAADGTVTVIRDVAYSDRPRWGIAPADWYRQACTVQVGGYIRAGLAAPNTPADWQLSNGLVRIRPSGTNLRWDIDVYDGTAWDTGKSWLLEVGGSEITGSWSAVTILRNDPEAAAIRLVRRTLTFDFLVRRGSRYIEAVISYNGTGSFKVRRVTAEAATAVTPTGATSAPAIRATSNDSQGNRYVIGTSLAHTQDLTGGGITWTNVSTFDFFVGAEIGGSAAQAGDTAEDLTLQYLGYVTERIVPVRR